MKFRVVKSGNLFQVKMKARFIPIWFLLTQAYFSSQDKAHKYAVDFMERSDNSIVEEFEIL